MNLTSNLRYFVLLNIVTFQFTAVNGKPQVPCFFIFGDSLVDTGNNNNLPTPIKANYLPYGIDFPTGPTGRFSNGRVAVDFIAQMLGFDKFIPPFANFTIQDVFMGINYGSAGAGILDETGSDQMGHHQISLNEQLRNHDTVIPRVVKLLGSREAARKHLKSCLYYVGMGNNDYYENYLPDYYAATTNYTAKQFAAILIKKYSNQLQSLYNKGARKVVVAALGKLGCVPMQRLTYGASACAETTNDVVRVFNEDLKLLIDDLNNRFPDAEFVHTANISDNASSHGNIRNLKDPCCAMAADLNGGCTEGGVPCSNRDEYYFWDAFHPTEAAARLSANVVYDSISPLLINLVDVM